MSMALDSTSFDAPAVRTPRLWLFIAVSIAIHLALFLFGLVSGGIFGGPGPGGGDAVTFRLAAGSGHDRFAAPVSGHAKPTPRPKRVEKPKPKPEPKPETVVRKKQGEAPKPLAAEPEVQPETSAEEAGAAGGGLPGGQGQGAGGDAEETILNRKGTLLSGGEITSRMGGRTFHLEMGRIDVEGGNRLINTVIALNPDGTSEVTLTRYFYQTYHSQYSSTRSATGTGRWWIEGNRWCHQSSIINYGTKDCYNITVDGPTVRLYYARCDLESSQLCKTGRIAGEGNVK
ncbi:MAG: hypothetical protein WBG82_09425 [Parvibaculum sp.]|uniref:hypothetical protein n=1 Tax=Parvibaculum sp. TaxID=2024848 RepID=UPI003C72C8C1